MNKPLRQDWKANILILLYSILLTLVYQYHVINMSEFRDGKWKWVLEMAQEKAKAYLGTGWSIPEKGMVFPVKDRAVIRFNLATQDTFSLRVKTQGGRIKNLNSLKLFLNGHRLLLFYKKTAGNGQKLYFKIPKAYTKIGENKLEFVFPEDWPDKVGVCSVKLRNYIGFNLHFPKGAILFDDSQFIKSAHFLSWKNLVGSVIIFFCIYLFLSLGSEFISDSTKIDFRSIYRKGLFSFLPGLCLFSAFSLFSVLTPYHFVMGIGSFVFVSFGLTAITWLFLSINVFSPQILPSKLPLPKAGRHLTSSRTYIIGFMVLLILCAFLLVFKQEKAAEQLAVVAYFLLVIGVGIEFYRLIKHKDESEKDT
ncbi:MAG: hypothetical protein LWW94_02570 [Candidatus Desulfofervidaceae bacterium]|nr:hypothetical protein [Candidatus Desulfofervidaceae bacterium]